MLSKNPFIYKDKLHKFFDAQASKWHTELVEVLKLSHKTLVSVHALYSLFFLIFCNQLLAQKPDKPRDIIKGPPGTVWLRDNLFIDQWEVTNIAYKEYLLLVKRGICEDSLQYNSAIPDTTVWNDFLECNEALVHLYFQNKVFNEYPVVGINYEQATNFCKWRSARVMMFYNMGHIKNAPKNISYRLPSKEEWEYAAIAGLSYKSEPYGFQSIIDKNNIPKTITKEYLAFYKSNAKDPNTFPINTGSPNRFNLYNLVGNVAEMISDKGVAKGGSWYHSLKDSKIILDQIYSKPTAWLGFRCICEVEQ